MGFISSALVVVLMATGSIGDQHVSASGRCDVTLPNEKSSPDRSAPDAYGNGSLSVSLPWPEGTVVFKPNGPGFVTPDRALSMKFGWVRRIRGSLTIDGRRLDADASPLQANIPGGYGPSGFQSTALIFPTPGCWEVTGHVGNTALTFVTRVVKIDEDPAFSEARQPYRQKPRAPLGSRGSLNCEF